MSYKEKHTLKFFDYTDTFTLIGLFDDYESLQVKYSKYEAHELNITVNKNIPNTELFRERRFVQLGNVSDCLFIITTVKESIDENGKGGNYLNIQARDCRYLYKRRMIMTINDVETWTETGNAETVLRHLITSQTSGKRSLPITNTMPDNPIGEQITLSEIHTNLYDVIRNYCQQGSIGWKINFDGSALTLVFYPVTDVSSVVKFTVDYESLKNGEFEESSENYKNVVYVGGKGSGTNQAIFEAETEIEGDSPSGIDRVETWVSDGSLTTESELQKTGESKLIEYSQKLNFSGNGLEKSPFEFRVHYDIGNIVEVAFGDRSANVEIISIQENWSYNEYDMEFEFGKPINYLSNQFSKMYNLLQKYNSTDAKTSSETKYYTIPTDIEQPIGDVVLDVIGFKGSTGDSDKTFKLYFDANGTGAKTYHVYFKQLAGSGKLILTTGVQGKTNLEFNSGTYVSIIDVDEEGNVRLTIGIQDGHISTNSTWSSSKTKQEIDNVESQIESVASNIPTDAILHYSFDDVPNLPDTIPWAEVKNQHYTAYGALAYSVSVGHTYLFKAKTRNNDITSTCKLYFFMPDWSNQEIIEFSNNDSKQEKWLTFTVPSTWSGNCYAQWYPNNTGASVYDWDIEYFYLYDITSQPLLFSKQIIDNSYGRHNAVNNGVLATKGICGKGIKGINGKYLSIPNFNLPQNYTISLWFNPSDNDAGKQNDIIIKESEFILRNGATWSSRLMCYQYGEDGTEKFNYLTEAPLPPNEWQHLVIVKNGESLKYYNNGVLISSGVCNETQKNTSNVLSIFSSDSTRESSVDDFQIFNRALSDKEVIALYNNKGNTPKFVEPYLKRVNDGGFSSNSKSYKSLNATETGFIIIRLPSTFFNHNMFSFKLRVSEYENNVITEFEVKGYAYENSEFNRCDATFTSNSDEYDNSYIWFGSSNQGDGLILISKTSAGYASYSYPQIDLYDISCGFQQTNYDFVANCELFIGDTASVGWAREDVSKYCVNLTNKTRVITTPPFTMRAGYTLNNDFKGYVTGKLMQCYCSVEKPNWFESWGDTIAALDTSIIDPYMIGALFGGVCEYMNDTSGSGSYVPNGDITISSGAEAGEWVLTVVPRPSTNMNNKNRCYLNFTLYLK